MNQRKIKDRRIIEKNEFPGSLDDRLSAILSCVNSEVKQVELLLLNKDPKRTSDLKREFDDITNYQFYVNLMTHRDYCADTFVPISMVCDERVMFDGFSKWVQAWSISEAGEHFGKPVAAFTLKKAIDYGQSFYELLGPVPSSGETRSPYRRVKIITNLYNSPMRIIDLANSLHSDGSAITPHLISLKSLGLVDYESLTLDSRGLSKYERTEKNLMDVRTVKHQKSLTNRVIDLIRENPKAEFECEGLAKILDIKDRRFVSSVLSGLEKQGFLRRTTRFKFGADGALSNVELTLKGRIFYEEYCKIVVSSLKSYDNAELTFMRDILNNYYRDYNKFKGDASLGVTFYKNVSPHLNMKTVAESCKEVYQIIVSSENGIRPSEIQNLTGKPPKKYLKILIDNNLVCKEKEGTPVVYKIKKN